jgi:hypothetical protein
MYISLSCAVVKILTLLDEKLQGKKKVFFLENAVLKSVTEEKKTRGREIIN